MKIKCFLKCTFETNDYIRVFSWQKDSRRILTPRSWGVLQGGEESWPESRQPASTMTSEPKVQINLTILFSTCIFSSSLISSGFHLWCCLSWMWLQTGTVLCSGGKGNYPGISQAAVKAAVQTHLKKHSLKNFNLLDLTWFVLKRLKSTQFINFWDSLNWGFGLFWVFFCGCTIIQSKFWFITFSKHTSTSWQVSKIQISRKLERDI